MYEDYFGLTVKPFHITPDLDFLFLSHNHQKAITCMEFGIMEDTGIILLTGDIGTGKTTLIRHMLTKFGKDIRPATIYNTNVNSKQLLHLIMESFDIENQEEKKSQLLKWVQIGLEEIHHRGQKPVIIIDDAQNLSLKTLEEVRQLSNLQSQDRMLVQIILVGQTDFKEKLDDPVAAALTQRIGISYHIDPFSLEETKAYIAHRLQIAGGKPDIFDPEALDLLYKVTQGIPRAINLICDHALVYGFADEIQSIKADTIQQVLTDNPGLARTNFAEINPDMPSPAEAPHAPKPLQSTMTGHYRKKSGNWQERVEARLQTLEHLMAEYNRELRDVLKTMFEKERQKNDNLMMKYAQLQTESDALKKKLTETEFGQPNLKTLNKTSHMELPGDS